jgi:hypothetical protein
MCSTTPHPDPNQISTAHGKQKAQKRYHPTNVSDTDYSDEEVDDVDNRKRRSHERVSHALQGNNELAVY